VCNQPPAPRTCLIHSFFFSRRMPLKVNGRLERSCRRRHARLPLRLPRRRCMGNLPISNRSSRAVWLHPSLLSPWHLRSTRPHSNLPPWPVHHQHHLLLLIPLHHDQPPRRISRVRLHVCHHPIWTWMSEEPLSLKAWEPTTWPGMARAISSSSSWSAGCRDGRA
jgi:hypothetical protein